MGQGLRRTSSPPLTLLVTLGTNLPEDSMGGLHGGRGKREGVGGAGSLFVVCIQYRG